jgi:sugar/nucleoside kinase (ribokinase family)
VHEGILDLVVPGVLADFVLPDLAGLAAVRPVWIVNPRGAGDATFAGVYADWLR